jgi:hypothetical protein
VIDDQTFCKIHDCHDRQRLTIAQTARALGLDPKTIATWIARPRFEPRRSRPRGSVLDPFKPRITRWLDTHPYSAQQIFQRLREEGYRGGAPYPANQAAGLSEAALRSRRVRADRLGGLRNRRGGQYPSPAFVLRHGAGVQPPNVRGVHRLPDHGAFPRLPRTRFRRLGRAVQSHGRQSQIRGSAAPGRRRAGDRPCQIPPRSSRFGNSRCCWSSVGTMNSPTANGSACPS